MIPPFIIEEIKKREEARRGKFEQPTAPHPPSHPDHEVDDDKPPKKRDDIDDNEDDDSLVDYSV